MIKLSDYPTRAPKGFEKGEIKKEVDKLARRIGDLQHILYAQEKYSLLVVLQGMDATGKDGVTRKVFSYCSPIGINAIGFKKPTEEEFAHDFLWRIHKVIPRKGFIQVFNRSHYEDILVQRVHKWIDEERVDQRMQAINEFERMLQKENNTTILKFYMHISPERQKEKLQERIDDPRKNWKHNAADWEELKYWDQYIFCYEDAIYRSVVPWIIAPVDQRWYRDYFIATKIIETLDELPLELPTLKR
ncbi:MAG TPA: PPK2 family polyphosphate kinase [Saprospiraceae bacterium]|nr:PPK2 family polyphosphate kinase [Saprospiraceae bacterium]